MQKYDVILKVALPVPLRRCFDYLPLSTIEARQLTVGSRLLVPFGAQKVVGILVGISDKSSIPAKALKEIIAVLDEEALVSPTLMQLCQFASQYYQFPLGEVLSAALPLPLRRGKPAMSKKKKKVIPQVMISNETRELSLTLNTEQDFALQEITKNMHQYQCFLLDGVTGSGKTEVYLQAIAACIAQEKQALILIPEIGLTPQTVARFAKRFNIPIAVMHSGLSDGERLHAWLMAKSGEAKIIIGTRSAVFAPLSHLGMIIIDEEHDISFKQQEGFRYSARDLAIVRALMENIPIILGSATPSLESFYNAKQQRYHRLLLRERAGNAVQPRYQLLDIRGEKLQHGLSPRLITLMQQHLAENNQVLLFINRRGYAPVLLCHHCAWIANCDHCDARLVWHRSRKKLHCHYCNHVRDVYNVCPACNNKQLIGVGLGTERLEQGLAEIFPHHKVLRIDRDTTRRKGALQNLLTDIHQGEGHILIGTQMLAKGHHFPRVTLVAIINADDGLYSVDFRAPERLGQLLLQVAGRAGRTEKIGEVCIQTHHSQHPFWQRLFYEGYENFADNLLQERATVQLPPFNYLALFRVESNHAQRSIDFLSQVKKIAKEITTSSIKLLGPTPAPQEKLIGKYRAQLLIQTNKRSELQNFLSILLDKIENLKLTRQVKWSLDVDPVDLF